VFIHAWTEEQLREEPAYGVRAVRLPALDGVEQPYEGGAWVVVGAGTTMTRHVNPDGESEVFFVTEGAGTVDVDGETRRVGPGATIPIPPERPHTLTADPDGRVVFLSMWWGGRPDGGAR
jgi:quercetin dioxygenase-like cupin family protein